jgi:NADH:ubiquinone oxidoreductase subunit 2 (subunit N)
VLNGVVSLYYYFNVVRHAFFMAPKEKASLAIQPTLRVVLLVCLVLVLAIGIFPQPVIRLVQAAAAALV